MNKYHNRNRIFSPIMTIHDILTLHILSFFLLSLFIPFPLFLPFLFFLPFPLFLSLLSSLFSSAPSTFPHHFFLL